MSARWTARVAWGLAGLSTCLALAYVVLLRIDVVSGRNLFFDDHWLPGVFWAIAWPVLGAVVLSKHPRNRLAWVFLALGLGASLGVLGEQYAVHGTAVYPGSLPAVPFVAWLSIVSGNISWLSTILIPQLFPDGRPASPRWRWLLRLTLLFIGLSAAYFAVRPGRLDSGPPVDNPFGIAVIASPHLHWLTTVSRLLLPPIATVVIVGSLASLVLRYRHARGPERQQMKVFVAAVVFTTVSLFYGRLPYTFLVNALTSLVPPVAFSFAILRYRLYEIDRVISRTFSYAVLTGLLVGVYVLLVTGATRLLPSSSSLAVAAATLAVAALFQPLRRRVQRTVDRRFNRSRYDAERTVEEFSWRLRGEVELATVQADLLAVVHATLQPASAGLWLRP